MAAAVQRVLNSAHEGQGWPEEMPEQARRQVIPGDGKCLYWALSAVDGAGGRAAAEEVRKALTEGEMARPPESGWARRVMRDAGARTWDQYLDKVRRGEIREGHVKLGGGRRARDAEWQCTRSRVGINKRCLLIFFGKLTNKRTNERTMKINERRLLIFFLVNVLSVCF